jgi:hypothetical protein
MRRDVRHRIQGVIALLVAGVLAFFCLSLHAITIRAMFVAPMAAAIGVWMIAFGYPKRADGLAPLWWRLGLIATVVVFVGVTLHFVAI